MTELISSSYINYFIMENSKSDGKSQKEATNSVNNQTIRDILNYEVEKEISSALVNGNHDSNQPSSSRRFNDSDSARDNVKEELVQTVQLENQDSKTIIHIVINNAISEDASSAHMHQPVQVQSYFNEATAEAAPTHVQNVETPNHSHITQSQQTDNREHASEVSTMCSVQQPTIITTFVPACTVEIPPTTSRGISMGDSAIENVNNPIIRGVPLGPPPSYSKSLLDRRVCNPCASIQFVAPIPPPSYDGMENELRYGAHTGFTLGLGNTWQGQPQPAYCPVCETVIITHVDVRVSRIAHIFAMVMLLLLCWPFCLLPYFLNVCNYTFHYCSVCHSYLGARHPFQRT